MDQCSNDDGDDDGDHRDDVDDDDDDDDNNSDSDSDSDNNENMLVEAVSRSSLTSDNSLNTVISPQTCRKVSSSYHNYCSF